MSSTNWSAKHDHADARRRVGGRPLVVLAEDNEDSRRVYGLILRHYGYQVEEAVNGAEAVELASVLEPRLVLMDLGLPLMDGWEAARVLKRDSRTRDIPLIAFSASIDSHSDLGHDARTFDGFIFKPISPVDLVQRVDEYVARFEDADAPTELEFDRYDDYEDRDPNAQLSA